MSGNDTPGSGCLIVLKRICLDLTLILKPCCFLVLALAVGNMVFYVCYQVSRVLTSSAVIFHLFFLLLALVLSGVHLSYVSKCNNK